MLRDAVGVVGLGRMGGNIARRLKDRGFRVAAVYDARPEVTQELAAELSTAAADSPAKVAALSQTVLTAVSDERAMEEIYAASETSLLAGGPGRLFVNTATVSPETHVEMERRALAAGSESLEACLLGTVPHARSGGLYVLAAGREGALRRAQPLLSAIGSEVRYVGRAGEAGKVKAIVNLVMNVNVAGLAEGLGLGAALGIDGELLLDALRHSAASSRVLETHAQAMLRGVYGRFLTAEHAAKDARIADDLAQGAGLPLPLAAAVRAQFERMLSQGLGQEDHAGVAQLTFPGRLGEDARES